MDSLISLDIETTGLDPERDTLIEIGAVRFRGRRVEAEWATLVNPSRAIPREITALTGISNEMVFRAPRLAEVAADLQAFVGNSPVVGHNVRFDLSFLQARGLLPFNETIDTYDLVATLYPSAGRYNLTAVGQMLGIPLAANHRALDDARVTHAVFVQLYARAMALPIDLLAELVRLGDGIEWGGGWLFRQVMRERFREPLGSGAHESLGPLFTRVPRRPAPPLNPNGKPVPLDYDEVAAILEHGGAFSHHFPEYEYRPQQVEMLRLVAWALSEGRHLLVEAGTGTGKSVAYLVPAALWALQNNRRVVVSTNTINLQDQLVGKDIPDIRAALGVDLQAVVLKGRANYLCPRRLQTARRLIPSSPEEMRVLAKVLIWLQETQTGDRQELTLNGPTEETFWLNLSAADDACTTETCLTRMGGICPFYRARQAAQSAHILIVNHALLLADVATGSRVLPEYEYLIVDEAHHMESAVTDALSFRVTQWEVERTIRELGSASSGVMGRMLTEVQEAVTPGTFGALHRLAEQATDHAYQFQNAARNFFIAIEDFLRDQREGQPVGPYAQQVRILPSTRTLPTWMDVETTWDAALNPLSRLVKTLESISAEMVPLLEAGVQDVQDAYGNLGTLYRRVAEMHDKIDGLVFKPSPGLIYWAETKGEGRSLSLQAAPLHIGQLMEKHLWHEKTSIILTSATLTTQGEFGYLRSRLQATDADEVAVGSPFDYESQAMLYLINNIPEPSDRHGHQRAVEQGLIGLARATGGRLLALFTSYAQLNQTARAITGPLAESGITVYTQGTGPSATTLLENFKTTDQAVLLGTRSFWEGVDVPGEALSALAIIKIPFDVPSDPIVAARSETFESPFQEYALPEAILRFRQGFGRLIRTRQDRGIIAVFDRRVLTKSYGRGMIESLPPCHVVAGPLQDLPRAAAQWLNL